MKKKIICNIMKVFAVGGTALLIAALGGFMAYLAIRLFMHTPALSGYLAVGAFISAVIALAASLATVYISGCWIVRKGKFAR